MSIYIAQTLRTVFNRYAEHVAAVDSCQAISYRELDILSSRLASQLKMAVHPSGKIVLAIDRSVYALVGIVAAIKAGIGYIPQEWDGKDIQLFERLPAADCVFMTRSFLADKLLRKGYKVISIDAQGITASAQSMPPIDDDSLLYTIYTSGSTGVAKGVDISRANISHYVSSLAKTLEINEPLNYAYVSSLSADLGNTALFVSLLTGGTLHFIGDALRRNAAEFQRYLADEQIDVLKITPSHFSSLCSDPHAVFRLKWLILGGEALASDLVRSVFERELANSVANHYGPTETTVGVSCFTMRDITAVPESGPVPVGFPIGKTIFELVNDEGEIVTHEPLAEGQLMIGGPSVGIGYSGDLELSARKFSVLAAQSQGGRFFASGDHFLRNAEGAYIFGGRKDRQVKIRGYRVDPDAIEALIVEHCQAQAAVVFPLTVGTSAHIQLVVALVPQRVPFEYSDTHAEMSAALERLLPEYMRPRQVMLLESMPITTNGKTDLKTLKAMLELEPERNASVDYGQISIDSEIVEKVVEIWSAYLGAPPAALTSDFYTEGGDSILAIQLLSALQNESVGIQASLFYQTPTFAGLLEAVSAAATSSNAIVLEKTTKRLLSPIQHWFFEQFPEGTDHWNQSVLIDCSEPLDINAMQLAVHTILKSHPLIATRFKSNASTWEVTDCQPEIAEVFDVLNLASEAEIGGAIEEMHQQISLSLGRLLRIRIIRQNGQLDRIALVCHHLVIDGVSWRILLDDLTRLYTASLENTSRPIAIDSRLYWNWTERLGVWTNEVADDLSVLIGEDEKHDQPRLRTDFNVGPNVEESTGVFWLGFDETQTHILLRELPRKLGVTIQNLLLAAFVRSVAQVLGENLTCLRVDVESHGRQLFSEALDLSRAFGWFTALFPFTVDLLPDEPILEAVQRLQSKLTGIEHDGIGYGAYRYLGNAAPVKSVRPELCFNYLGHFGVDPAGRLGWSLSDKYPGATRAPDSNRLYGFKLTGRVVDHRLGLDFSYSRNQYSQLTVEHILTLIEKDLVTAIAEIDSSTAQIPACKLYDEVSSTGLLTYIPTALRGDISTIASDDEPVKSVLLTGATGFIGVYVLRELLSHSNAIVHCMVRGRGGESPSERLRQTVKWYFPDLEIESIASRIIVHDADIVTEHLGLAPAVYSDLAESIDVVLHLAADVRLMAPLEELRRTNVQGTSNVLEFCLASRVKQLHLLSTLSVAGVAAIQGSNVFSEDDLQCGQSFLTPYEQSKYEAEILVQKFVAAGGRACIHRTGSVSADITGTFQMNFESNRVMQSIATYALIGMVPDRDEDLLLCRVDDLARSFVRVALDRLITNGTFHLTPRSPFMHNSLAGVLRNLGLNVSLVPRDEYLEGLKRIEDQHPRLAILGRTWALRTDRGISIDASRTDDQLHALGVPIAPIDVAWFSRFLKRCGEHGYLPRTEVSF